MTSPAGGMGPKIPASHKVPSQEQKKSPEQAKVENEAQRSVQELKQKFQRPKKTDIPVVKEDTSSTAPGIVKERKIAQQKLRTQPGIGSQSRDLAQGMDAKVHLHRHPTLKIKDFMDEKSTPPGSPQAADKDYPVHNLTAIRDYKLNKWVSEQPDPKAVKEDLRLMAKMKEKFNEEAYESNFQGNVDGHLYDPGAIGAEMRSVLKFKDEPPFEIKNHDDAKRAIAKELRSFHVEGTGTRILSDENVDHLCDELLEVMRLYQSVYPNRSVLDVYVLCRDMARVAAYQTYFDKKSFTGSDHGVLHIFHNCKHGHNMFSKMNEHGDADNKTALLSIIAHFYHDVGYSVGSAKTSFEVMKDHPFIGAGFIRANREYFANLLCDKPLSEDQKKEPGSLFADKARPVISPGVKATKPGEIEAEIIERAILNHAIVSFDSDTTDLYKMVRFTTSNSDACAVTADQKTQSFWRDHPETLLELARLRMFITIYPECAKQLGDSKIIKTPEAALASWLKDPSLPNDKIFDKNNFKNDVYYKAYTIHVDVKNKLLAIADQEHLPPEEQEAFKSAILDNFNSFGADVVLKQYGAELHDVSVHRNEQHGPNEPKWLPDITIGPSTLYAFLESCYSKEIAGGNIKKLLNEEYGAKIQDITNAVDDVGSKTVQTKDVPCKVAKIHIHPSKKKAGELSHLTDVVKQLDEIRRTTIPIEMRQTLNDYIDSISPKENKSKPTETPKDAKGAELVKIGDKFYSKSWEDDTEKYFKELSAKSGNLQDSTELLDALEAVQNELISGDPSKVTDEMKFALRSAMTTDADWNVMKLAR